MIFLVNPKKGKRRMAKKRRSAAQRRATAKLVAFNKRRRKKPVRRRAKRKTTKRKPVRRKATVRRKPRRRRKTVAARRTTRRRRTTRKRTTRRRSPVRRRARRNPPQRAGFKVPTFNQAIREVQQGVFDAGGVIVGKAATRIVANMLPIPKDTMMMNFVVQAGSAIVVGIVARMVVSRDAARMMIAGGFAAPVESFLKGMPFIGPMLGDDYLTLGEYAMGDTDPFLPIGNNEAYNNEVGEYAIGDYAYG